jgi:two-component system NtrC family response regulator
VVSIDIPPLRERREDIPHLVDHFIRRFSEDSGSKVSGISREAMDVLLKYDFPGNVRELENTIHRAIVLARGRLVSTSDLPLHLGELEREKQDEASSLVDRVAAFERALIVEALGKADGVKTRAARALGISERHLRYRINKYGLESNDGKADED